MTLDLTPAHGRTPRGRLCAALALIVLFSEIATFEILMVLPAVPHISADFQSTGTAWVVGILTLTGATLMPLIGKASDRWGKKRIILLLGVVFIAGSAVCALAPTFPVLLLGRAMQGAMVGIVGLSYGLVRDIMPRDFVPVALGVVVTGVGMSAIAGPFIAGLLIDGFGYRAVFWFMALYLALVMVPYAVLIPESPVRADQPIDYLSTALLGPGICLLLVGVSAGARAGWTAPAPLVLLLLGTAMLVAFAFRQRTARHPLIDPRVLLGGRFGPTLLAVACVSYVMNAHAFVIPTMLQAPTGVPGAGYASGLSALEYALWTCPLGITAMLAGPAGGVLAKRIGARWVLIGSAVLFLVVIYLGSRLFTVQWQVAIMSLTAGLAVGFLHSANANLIQDALPASQSGVGSTVGSMTTLLAAAVGTTITGTVMSGHVLQEGPDAASTLYTPGAFTQAYLVAAVVGAAGLLVAVRMKHGRRPAEGGMSDPEPSDDGGAVSPRAGEPRHAA